MRWIFHNPADPEERRQREETLRRIDDWWKAFSAKTGDLDDFFRGRSKWDLPGWVHQTLHAIDPRLMWEFGADPAGHRLVITPEGERHLRPLTQAILDAAPRIDGWRFYGYRQPESVEAAAATVEDRTGGNLSGVTTRVRAAANNTVELTYFSPRFRSPEDQAALRAAFVATESLLGEELLDKWVGLINVGPPVKGERTIPLDRLRPTAESVVQHVREQLPDKPCHEWGDDASGAVFKTGLADAKPTDEDLRRDFPEKSDLVIGSSMYHEMVRVALGPWPFFSERFSRWGETFCYLKIDGSEGLEGSTFQDRSDIEDALDAALKPAGLGAVLGGGSGLRYAYVDLALTDLGRGAALVREVLADGRIPRRSWVLFNDAALKAEWVGVYDDTPGPPHEDEDSTT